jgi:hypothetical protein
MDIAIRNIVLTSRQHGCSNRTRSTGIIPASNVISAPALFVLSRFMLDAEIASESIRREFRTWNHLDEVCSMYLVGLTRT